MTENSKPQFQDIIKLIKELPDYPTFETNTTEPFLFLQKWLEHHSRLFDLSKGFLVNRCALYWAGYDVADGFDGQGFVDSCQDHNGSLNQLAQMLDTDLQIFELDPNNYTKATLDDIAMATSYGMMGVEENTQLFCACSFGQGVEATAQKAMNALNNEFTNLESFMEKHCGLDHAALLGASIACIMKGIPMIVEGTSGRLAKTMIEKETGKTFSNIIVASDLDITLNHSHPGQRAILSALMLKALMASAEKTSCGKVKLAA